MIDQRSYLKKLEAEIAKEVDRLQGVQKVATCPEGDDFEAELEFCAKRGAGVFPWSELEVMRSGTNGPSFIRGRERLQLLIAFKNGDLPAAYFVRATGVPIGVAAVNWEGFQSALHARGLA